ncbi:MAG: hypothetical protein PHU93_01180 [Candidatus Gracilibacteria bacterium]|nr:hypothetical protein [Candidatus Gracilibacteria bacterium]
MSKAQELLLSASAVARSKKAKLQALAFATVAAVSTVGLTVSDGLLPAGQPAGTVSFDLADKTQVGTSVGVAVSNLWNAFIFVLPYLAVFVGVALVIGIVMRKVGQGGR